MLLNLKLIIMKKLFFTAIAVCALSTATFAADVKEVKVETTVVSENVEEVVVTDCAAVWRNAYNWCVARGVAYQNAANYAFALEADCKANNAQ